MSNIQLIKTFVREIPDFPKPGINFKDITPIVENPRAYKLVLQEFINNLPHVNFNKIVGIESRGFIFGMLLANELNLPFVLARKKGKLPYQKISKQYELEYGTSEIEMHVDSIKPNDKVLIHDDLLATGGTAKAVADMIIEQNASVDSFAFLIELEFLKGIDALKPFTNNIVSLLKY